MFCVLKMECIVCINSRLILNVVSSVLSGWLYRWCSISCFSVKLMMVVVRKVVGSVVGRY